MEQGPLGCLLPIIQIYVIYPAIAFLFIWAYMVWLNPIVAPIAAPFVSFIFPATRRAISSFGAAIPTDVRALLVMLLPFAFGFWFVQKDEKLLPSWRWGLGIFAGIIVVWWVSIGNALALAADLNLLTVALGVVQVMVFVFLFGRAPRSRD
jgi:hypothetical protein